jgi:hypothetical protein
MFATSSARIRLAVATVLTGVGFLALTAAPAQAASFYEDNSPDALWTGSGGVKYRCSDDATTVREAYWPGGGPLAVELRYSKRCRTVWGRSSIAYYLEVQSYTRSSGGSPRASRYAGKNPTAPSTDKHWTVMLDDTNLYGSACIGWDGSGWETLCTGRY